MKRRVLLVVLAGVSLVLAVTIRYHQAVSGNLKKSLTHIDDLPEKELVRFRANAENFYESHSKAVRDERKRLRALYYRIHNDPESERLTQTLALYVDWVNRFNDPAMMRAMQSWSIDERVDYVHKAVLEERNVPSGPEQPTIEFMKANFRDALPPELWLIAHQQLADAFDVWLTTKYADAFDALLSLKYVDTRTGQKDDHLKDRLKIEEFFRDLFRQAGMETLSGDKLGIPEKMAMLQLIQNLSNPQRTGGGSGGGPGVLPRSGGGSRPGGRIGDFNRLLIGGPQVGGGNPFRDEFFRTRDEFFRTTEEAFDRQEPSPLDSLDDVARQTLSGFRRPARTEALQGMLALALLERYPASVDARRIIQAVSTSRQEQEWVEILGAYLSLMTPQKREEFLKLDSRFTTNRLQEELWFGAVPFYGLLRTNRDRQGPPPGTPPPGPPLGIQPGPPREAGPPDDGPNRPRPVDNGLGRDRRPDSGQE